MKKALSLILCLMMLFGAFSSLGLNALAAKSDPAPLGTEENPYVVGSYYQLRNYAKEYRDRGEVVYVKLAADLTYRGAEGELVTNGADVVIDLSGYTISVETERLDYMMYGKNGKFIIRDSGRYDLDKGQTVDGRIEYEYKKYVDDGYITFFNESNMLLGDFVIEGGTLVNKNYKDTRIDSVYRGDSLVMTGGTLEGCYPIRFTNTAGKSRISGGTLKTKLGAGIKVDRMSGSKLFTVEGVTMINATGKAKAAAFEADFADGYAESHTGDQAITYWNGILGDNTYAYIDGARQAKGVSGAYYDGDGGILGPAFSDTYELVSTTEVDTLSLTIKEPKAGDTLPYNVAIPTDSDYKIVSYNRDNEWKNGVEWTRGDDYNTPYPVGTRFDGDKSYTVFIKVGLNDMKHTDFADPVNINATVNGKKAKVYNSSAYEMTVYCTFNVEMNKISEIAITLPTPKRGGHPSFDAAVPADSLYHVQTSNNADGFTKGVSWTDVDNHLSVLGSSDSFDIGSYTVLVMVEANDPYYTRFADYSDITATINGESANVIPYSSTVYGIARNYELSDRIKSVEITIDEPLPDENPSYEVTLPDDALYTVNIDDEDDLYSRNGVLWEEGKYVFPPSYTFVEGNDYIVSVTLEPIDKENYRFADSGSFSATINGNKASYRFYEGLCIVSYTFTVPVYCDIWIYNAADAEEPMAGTEVPRGAVLGPIDAMTREGYDFAGWYTDRACTEPYDPTQPIMEDTCIYPKWEKKEVILLGDADGDGKVTIIDATCIQRRLASLPTSSFVEQAADTDEDGKTTIIDATYIQRWLAGLKSNDKIGQPVA